MSSARSACLADDPADVLHRQAFAIIPTTIVLFFSVLTYLLRILAKKKTRQELDWDDYLMGVGLIISIEPAVCEFLLIPNGLGHHACNLTKEELARFLRISFALQRANQPALSCIKTSIVLFLLRVFPVAGFRKAAYAVIAYTVIWGISTWVVNLNVCTPVAYFYDKTIPGGYCRNQAVSATINAALSLLGDVLVIALPMPMIFGLKINKAKKVALAGIFLLGCFGCIASAIRIAELIKFTATDASYTQVYATTWTTLEMGAAVISGNLPVLGPLFKTVFSKFGSSHDATTKKSGAFNSARSGPHLTYNDPVETAVSTKHHFERLSDSDSQLESSATNDIELESGIRIERRVVVTVAPGNTL